MEIRKYEIRLRRQMKAMNNKSVNGWKEKIRVFVGENKKIVCVAVITAILYTVTGIIFHSNFLNLLPLYISLIVMLLQSAANRYTFLLGAVNCLIYTVVYLYMGLYGSVISTICFSCPIQVITFLQWRKRAYKQSTIFRKMTPLQFAGIGGGTVLACVLFYAALVLMGSSHSLLDSVSNIFSIGATLLCMLSFVEYGILNLVTCLTSLFMMITIAWGDASYAPWVIASCYNLICILRANRNMRRLYKEQQENSGKAA